MYKVLIVEDDPMVAKINEQYVTKNKKFSVAGKCRDGAQALEFLKKNEVDLIIMDVFMPHMDGLETLHKIRELGLDIPTVMVTAANDSESVEEALNLGVVDYLVKPFAFDRFQLALEKFDIRMDALDRGDSFDQRKIDRIFAGGSYSQGSELPKGIQKETCDNILSYLRLREDAWMSGDEIAAAVNLSSVTVRRYMNYLVKEGTVTGEINYETGGRPCMLYKLKQ